MKKLEFLKTVLVSGRGVSLFLFYAGKVFSRVLYFAPEYLIFLAVKVFFQSVLSSSFSSISFI